MPTNTTSRFPPPTSWDEFEEICKSAFSLRWDNPNLSMHGRQGQKQDGVDIYGLDSMQNLVGVQCKNTTKSINKELIDSECLKAEKFTPELTALYIATTADGDVHIQNYVRQLSFERKKTNKFTVDVVFWRDIIHDLSRSETEIRRHYPQYYVQQSPSPAQLRRESDVIKITSLLEVIDFKAISEHLIWGAKYINHSIMEHLTQIESVRYSPIFYIHDQLLLSSVDTLVSSWKKLISLINDAPYLSNQNTLIFCMPGDGFRNKEENYLFEEIDSAIHELKSSIKSFCQLINANYLELSFEKTNAKARRLYCKI